MTDAPTLKVNGTFVIVSVDWAFAIAAVKTNAKAVRARILVV